MSLLGNLFGGPPDPFPALEAGIAAEFAVYKRSINQMIERENTVLRSLGIPLPRLVAEVSYRQERIEGGKIEVRIVAPQFELPPYRQFFINWWQVATVYEDNENIEKFEIFYRWFGFAAVLNNAAYRFVWTNRQPLKFYTRLQEEPQGRIHYARAGDFAGVVAGGYQSGNNSQVVRAKHPGVLEAVPGLSVEEAARFHLRFHLYHRITDNRIRYPSDPGMFYQISGRMGGQIPDEVLYHLPVPLTRLPADSHSAVKILPSGAIKPARMIEFLSSLRTVNQFIFFELLRQGESVYFRLQMPTSSAAQIVSKLKLFFPDFEVIADDTAAPVLFQYVNWLQKPLAYCSLKRLRDFQLDPYAHFAEFFDAPAAPGEVLGYQIVFAPLADEAAATIKRGLEKWTEKEYMGWLAEFAGKFADRLPLWFVGICVSSTNQETAGRLARAVAATLDAGERCFDDPYDCTVGDTRSRCCFRTS